MPCLNAFHIAQVRHDRRVFLRRPRTRFGLGRDARPIPVPRHIGLTPAEEQRRLMVRLSDENPVVFRFEVETNALLPTAMPHSADRVAKVPGQHLVGLRFPANDLFPASNPVVVS